MVLTLTVVGNGQGTGPQPQPPPQSAPAGHTVISPNDLAQLMSGQTLTGLLNPDGTITLNHNVMSTQQLTTISPSIQNGSCPPNTNSTTSPTNTSTTTSTTTTTTTSTNCPIGQATYPTSQQYTNTTAINSIDMQQISDPNLTPQTNQTNNNTTTTNTQKKTAQKKLTAKQKLAQQQQKAQSQIQPSDTRQIITSQDHINQQPQIVATVQLPNGQIGQLIAPSGGHFWSPNAINLQQLSMAVAVATGSMPQTMSIPGATPGQQGVAQQGVMQLSTMHGIPAAGPNGHRVDMIPQSAIQGLMNQNGQQIQAIPLASSGQMITQDPSDPNKWQLVQSTPNGAQNNHHQQTQQNSHQINAHNSSSANSSQNTGTSNEPTITRSVNSYSPFINNNSTQSTVHSESSQQSGQPQRKLKRLACTCPNCRDGDNSRSNSGDKKKQHICHFPDCNKVYGKTSHLRAHLRWHSGERPYVCSWSFCGKKFTRSDELQRHRRTHTGEKRFQCQECLKRFMRSDHLSKHLKTHTSSKKGTLNTIQQTTGQQQQVTQQPQVINGVPMTGMQLNLNESAPIKMEDNMIDHELGLAALNDSSKPLESCYD